MHELQVRLLELAQTQNLAQIPLRKLGEMVGVGPKPQVINHHLEQLQKKGFLAIDRNKGYMKLLSHDDTNDELVRIPILGAANCGQALRYATEATEGYLTISKRLLGGHIDTLYALRATGDSMNDVTLPLLGGGYGPINENDYLLVDSADKNVNEGDTVVSDIDGVANVKRFSQHNGVVILMSQSKTQTYHPIFIDPNEVNYYLCGKVKKIVKFGVTRNSA